MSSTRFTAYPQDADGWLFIPEPTIERFCHWVRGGDSGACWEWTGARNPQNYGIFHFLGTATTAHRASYMISTRRVIPLGYCVCHRCDFRPCVNPVHLQLLTEAENIADRTAKGRSNGRAFLGDANLCRSADYKSSGRMRLTVEERFWSRVEKSDSCWLWKGCRHKSGYGTLHVSSGPVKAHRLSWELHYGLIPTGLHVLHACDIRRCVNPAHLRLGTHAENMADMKAKGRGRSRQGDEHWSRTNPEKRATGACNGMNTHPEARTRGESNHFSTLTGEMAMCAITRYGTGESLKRIANELQVSPSCLRRLYSGNTWAEVSDEMNAARVQAVENRAERQESRIRAVREARLAGATVREICEIFSADSSSVKTWTADLQIDRRRTAERLSS